MDRFWSDWRVAWRRTMKSPGFTAVAVLTLSLGIGANIVVFTLMDSLFLGALPVNQPQQLVSVSSSASSFATHSYPNFQDLQQQNQTFTGLLGYRFVPAAMNAQGQQTRIWGYLATGNYFPLLGVQPALGRLLTPDDDLRQGAHPVVVLSFGLWQRRFGGRPEAIGERIKLNGLDYTIIGVAPLGFRGLERMYGAEFWAPMMMQPQLEPGNPWLNSRPTNNLFVAGRLKAGVTREQATGDLNRLAQELGRVYPKINEGLRFDLVEPGLVGSFLRQPVIGFTSVIFLITGLVLLIVCTNLASLLLARASDRRREVAVRLALGASTRDLLREVLTESLLLSFLGSVAGLLAAQWLVSGLAAMRLPIDAPMTLELSWNLRTFLFALTAAMVSTLLFGLGPALTSAQTRLLPALKNEAESGRMRHWPLRDLLVGAQVALSVVLLAGSVLVIRSLQQAMEVPLGFRPEGMVSASIDLAMEGYSKDRARALEQTLLRELSLRPGLESVALTSSLQLSLNVSAESIFIEGKPQPKAAEAPSAYTYQVSAGYFATMGTRVKQGRLFDDRDQRDSTSVAVVNETFARRMFPNENPIGRRLAFGPDGQKHEIVGVVEDGKYFSLSEAPALAVYRPAEQWLPLGVSIIARSKLPAPEALQLLTSAVHQLDSGLTIYDQRSLYEHLELPLFPAKMAARVLTAFGGLAALLAAVGIYGAVAYSVARRRKEIGIRMAIGASATNVLSAVLHRTVVITGAGVVAGVLLSIPLGRVMGAVLFGVNPHDPLLLGLAVLLLVAIAVASSWWPASRALKVDPLVALRTE
ncbi:MAG: ABC transporter permease [Acidobacteria bacterium]|nr:ABC transporter permease [Acidobacteriota bacterium]